MKEKRLIDIKNVGEFYNQLKEIVANTFNSWDECGLFDGLTEKQKRDIYYFGCCLLSRIYTPIQKRYTMQERKKYNKQIVFYENSLKKYMDENQQLRQSQKELAINELNKFDETITRDLFAKAKIGSFEECIYSYVLKLLERQIAQLKESENGR